MQVVYSVLSITWPSSMQYKIGLLLSYRFVQEKDMKWGGLENKYKKKIFSQFYPPPSYLWLDGSRYGGQLLPRKNYALTPALRAI